MQDIAPWLKTYEEKDDSRAVEAMKKASGAMAEAQKAVDDLQLTTGDCVEALRVAAESYRGAEEKWQALPLCAGEKLQVKAEMEHVQELEGRLRGSVWSFGLVRASDDPDSLVGHRFPFHSFCKVARLQTLKNPGGFDESRRSDVEWSSEDDDDKRSDDYLNTHATARTQQEIFKGASTTTTMWAARTIELLGTLFLDRVVDCVKKQRKEAETPAEDALSGEELIDCIDAGNFFQGTMWEHAAKEMQKVLLKWEQVEDDCNALEDGTERERFFRSWLKTKHVENFNPMDLRAHLRSLGKGCRFFDFGAVLALAVCVEYVCAEVIDLSCQVAVAEAERKEKTMWYKAMLYTDNQSQTEHPYVLAHNVETSESAHESRSPPWPKGFLGNQTQWGDVRGVDVEDFMSPGYVCICRRHIYQALYADKEIGWLYAELLGDSEWPDGLHPTVAAVGDTAAVEKHLQEEAEKAEKAEEAKEAKKANKAAKGSKEKKRARA